MEKRERTGEEELECETKSDEVGSGFSRTVPVLSSELPPPTSQPPCTAHCLPPKALPKVAGEPLTRGKGSVGLGLFRLVLPVIGLLLIRKNQKPAMTN